MLTPKEFVYTTDDLSGWSSALPIQESVFGSVQFARIVQKYLGQQAALYVLRKHNCLIAYPFFLRSIRSSSVGQELNGCLLDTVSPEFTGPLAFGAAVKSVAAEFAKRFSTFAFNQRLITEFIHLHPWKAFTNALVRDYLEVNREIVYVDLTWPEQQLWRASFSHACRKNINRSQHENVRVFEAQTMGDIREFHRLYIQTMNGHNALKHYYYPLDYFSAIFEELRHSTRFVLAEYKNQMVAGTLYLHDRDDVYSYLGGADMNFQHVRPTNAVIYDTILWGKRQGKRRLILGGGYSPNDGIFRFKGSFSPERATFFVYKRVHFPEMYAALCWSWSSTHGQNLQTTAYFPPYQFLSPVESLQDCCNAATKGTE